MKKFIALVVVLCAVMITSSASAAKGVVVFYGERSNKIIIETDSGHYTCGEVSGLPFRLRRGDEVAGELESTGRHELYNITEDESFYVWISDYWLNKERAFDWLERNS
ncbi:MAG: hypothetical protein SR1Q5_09095 [Quinella sp. 1Q5]|nr:hypothetical protein [Quinella sp. 1Q5]